MDSWLNNLPSKIAETLYRVGLVSSKAILEMPECELCNIGGFTNSEIQSIFDAACVEEKGAEFVTGDQLSVSSDKRWGFLTTGCLRLDNILGGGVLTRGITELSGQSGCGKTQLCLQLAIAVQLPFALGGLDAGAVFICTEDKFPSVRLNQLANSGPVAKKCPTIKFENNVFIEHISDAVDLQKCVEERLPAFIRNHKIGLIVVDSVAAIFRVEYTAADALQRARDLRNFAGQLHLLASTKNISVVCVNQVSDVKRGDTSYCVPALGLAWANLVTTRLQMFRANYHRRLEVLFAPHIPQQSCQYRITAEGIFGY